jgi:hypothetical protein
MGTKAFKGVKMTGEQQDLPYPAAARYNEKRRLRVRGGDALKCGNKSLPEMNLRGRLFFRKSRLLQGHYPTYSMDIIFLSIRYQRKIEI